MDHIEFSDFFWIWTFWIWYQLCFELDLAVSAWIFSLWSLLFQLGLYFDYSIKARVFVNFLAFPSNWSAFFKLFVAVLYRSGIVIRYLNSSSCSISAYHLNFDNLSHYKLGCTPHLNFEKKYTPWILVWSHLTFEKWNFFIAAIELFGTADWNASWLIASGRPCWFVSIVQLNLLVPLAEMLHGW